jgi:hypothetical protein
LRGLLAAVLLGCAGTAQAAELLRCEVRRLEDTPAGQPRYLAEIAVDLAVPPARALHMLLNPAEFSHTNRSIREVGYLPGGPPGGKRIRVHSEVCILAFCFEYTNVQDMLPSQNPAVLELRVVPELSDFSGGYTRWRVTPQGAGTRLEFSTELHPTFWVPPLIGVPLMQSRAGEIALDTSLGMECEQGVAASCEARAE